MKKIALLILLAMSSVGWGAYSATPVSMNIGGVGYITSGAATSTIIDYLTINKDHPIKLGTNGTGYVKSVHCRMDETGVAPLKLKFKFFRVSGSDLVFVGESDCASQFTVGAASQTFTFETPIAVNDGDLVGVYIQKTSGVGPRINGWGTAETNRTYYMSGANVDVAETKPLSFYYSTSKAPMSCDFYTTTSDFTFEITSPVLSDDGSVSNEIPFFVSENQYIVLQDVVVPDNELLQIKFNYTNYADQDTTALNVQISFADGANDNKITIDNFSTSQSLADVLSGNQSGDKFDLHVWFNPTTSKADVLYVNKTKGQSADIPEHYNYIKHISITSGATATVAVNSAYVIKRVILQKGTDGTSTVGKIIVCRKPVLAMADSYATGYTDSVASLAYVGAALPTAFSQTRYVVPCGIQGSAVWYETNTTSPVAFVNRWPQYKLYRDVIYAFINGPSLNDTVLVNSTAKSRRYALRKAAEINRMVCDALLAGNDIILSDENIYPAGTTDQLNSQKFFNFLMQTSAYTQQVSYAETYDNYLSNGGWDGTGSHPDSAGSTWLATQMVEAYENNSYPNSEYTNIGAWQPEASKSFSRRKAR